MQIEQALSRLERIPMTLNLLSSTGIGKIVNRLRLDEEFGNKASKIVESWRNMARNTQKRNDVVEKDSSKDGSNNLNV